MTFTCYFLSSMQPLSPTPRQRDDFQQPSHTWKTTRVQNTEQTKKRTTQTVASACCCTAVLVDPTNKRVCIIGFFWGDNCINQNCRVSAVSESINSIDLDIIKYYIRFIGSGLQDKKIYGFDMKKSIWLNWSRKCQECDLRRREDDHFKVSPSGFGKLLLEVSFH